MLPHDAPHDNQICANCHLEAGEHRAHSYQCPRWYNDIDWQHNSGTTFTSKKADH